MDMSNWYLVQIGNPVKFHCIAQGDTDEIARDKIVITGEVSTVSQINWGALSHLTNCIIPAGQKVNDFATGPLTFPYKDTVVTLVG